MDFACNGVISSRHGRNFHICYFSPLMGSSQRALPEQHSQTFPEHCKITPRHSQKLPEHSQSTPRSLPHPSQYFFSFPSLLHYFSHTLPYFPTARWKFQLTTCQDGTYLRYRWKDLSPHPSVHLYQIYFITHCVDMMMFSNRLLESDLGFVLLMCLLRPSRGNQ